jgi:DUF4097 and DUF4098 domain-containing protein YvlB
MTHARLNPRIPHTSPRGRAAAWILFLATFLLLSLAASLRADPDESGTLTGRASKSTSFNATGAIRSLSLENVNGDVSIVAGSAFTATVNLTAKARTEAQAQKVLEQSGARFQNENGDLVLYTTEPGTSVSRTGKSWSVHSKHGGDSRVEARYTVTLPAAASLDVSVVNGAVSVKDIAGEMKISSVNGRIELSGARHDVKLNTVNGNIDASLAELPQGARVKVDTVNGNTTLRLPADAQFRFTGRTMSGDIASTFAMPPSGKTEKDRALQDAEKERARAEKDRLRAERDRAREEVRRASEEARGKERSDRRDRGDNEDEIEMIDLSELNESLAEMNREMAEMGRELSRNITIDLNRSYEGTVGSGGASVQCSNLNGRIAILALGADETQAKSLVSSRTARVITVPNVPPVPRIPSVPRVVVRVPRAPRPPRPAREPREPRGPRSEDGEPEQDQGSIVRGDIDGDFYSSIPVGDVRLGKVTGKVKITTHAGQIRVAEAGKGAELSTSGGDVRVDAVTGDLKATTYGGDIVVGSISGDARLETMGGDITLCSAGGSVTARTGGGDILLTRVREVASASTGGGSIVCEIVSKDPKGGANLSTGGGDVTLTIPANYKGTLDVRVSGVDAEGEYIVSQFPELTITKRHGSESAEGKLNGGSPQAFVVRCSSGTVTIKKGPAA